jgi:hypothetical protein
VLLFAATGHLPHHAKNIHVLFHMVTGPATAPDLTGTPPELVPLLTTMLSYDAQDRPALTDVVQQCHALVEAQGLKLAQARRRLTTYTAAPPLDFPTLLPTPVSESVVPPAPMVLDPSVARLGINQLGAVYEGLMSYSGFIAGGDSDPARYRRELQRARSLLFVAATRAHDSLDIFWHGAPSPFLARLLL